MTVASLGIAAFLLFWLARLWIPWTVVGLAQVPWAAAWTVWMAIVPPKPRYDVFLSYRRAGGSEFARLVRDKLQAVLGDSDLYEVHESAVDGVQKVVLETGAGELVIE